MGLAQAHPNYANRLNLASYMILFAFSTQQGLPEDKVTIILMLLADMLNSIIREITALATHNEENLRGAAIVNIFFLVFICLLVFPAVNVVLFLVYICFEGGCPDHAEVIVRRIIITLIQTLGGMFYFFGDNIEYIMQNYSEELGCGEQCVVNVRIAAVVTLGLALIILQLFPVTFSQLDFFIKDQCSSDWNDETSVWNNGMEMITIIVKVDILYTAVAVMTQTNEFCGHIDVALSGSFIAICMVAGIAFMVVNFFYSWVKIDEDSAIRILVPSLFLLMFTLCLYLLADNQQPLDCGFNCDTFAANQTLNEIACDAQTNSGVRFAFMLLSLGIATTLSFIWICIGMYTSKDVDEVPDGPEDKKKRKDSVSKVV